MNKVSVLMPSYNYAPYLPFAIKGVLSQSYSNLELIIVDDCSTDGSREIVNEWKRLDDRIVTVYHDSNYGLSVARNSGIAVSSGEFIALCDSDDIWSPEKLQMQIERFRLKPELGLVHSDAAIIGSDGKLTGQRFSSLIHRNGQITSGNLFGELCQRNFLCVPTVILRREAIEYAGGFDNRLRSLEDWVCWTKVSIRYPFLYIDDALVQYRIHGASLSNDSKNMAESRVKALRIILESISEIPAITKSKMMYSLGMSFLEIADPASAADSFLQSIKENPGEIRSWVRYGQSALKLGRSRLLKT